MSEKPNDSRSTGEQEDKRKKLRAPLLVRKVQLDDGGKVFFGYAKNISCDGIFIATANPRAPGSRFRLEMTLPAVEFTFQATCEVVWKREFSLKSPHDEPGMGLVFVDLPGDVAERINAWVEIHKEQG